MKKLNKLCLIKQLSVLSIVLCMTQSLNASAFNKNNDKKHAEQTALTQATTPANSKAGGAHAQEYLICPQATTGKRRTKYTKAFAIKGSSRVVSTSNSQSYRSNKR